MTTSGIGSFFVLAGLAFAAFGAVVGIASGLGRREAGYPWVRRATWAFALSMLLANVTMEYALLARDFSVRYVAQVGSHATPNVYTMVSLWSALEGSILFWGFLLGAFVAAFLVIHRRDNPRFTTLALGVMLVVGAFFAFLLAGVADPFVPTPPPVPADGPGPNPLLQNHILMVVHPPALYLGYVGLTVPFSIAVAALLAGELGESWLAPLRRWTLVPWLFLSIGIVLGGWWAYAVLGWGGYWAWDPVENASFMPWLVATAFMHSTLVQERRKILRLWTIALALASFWLTLLGTFMTRSGVFNSVHAFTQSDIGPTFLGFLAIVMLASIALLTVRGPQLAAQGRLSSLASREFTVLVNNLVLVAFTFTVFIGTVFPLLTEALQGRRISVGEPYFDKFAIPLGILTLLLMGVGPALPWGAADKRVFRSRFVVPTVAGVVTAAICLAAGLRGASVVAFGVAAFATVVTFREMFLPVAVRMREKGESFGNALILGVSKSRRRFGGYVVHLGVIVTVVAIAASKSYSANAAATIAEGESLKLQGYDVKLVALREGREPHREWVGAEVLVTAPSGAQETMLPKLNFYERSNDPIGTPAVRTVMKEDLYLSLVTFDPRKGTASLRAWVFPLVGWIWWSLVFFLVGTLLAVWPSSRASALAVRPSATLAPAAPADDAQRGAA